MSEQWMQYRPKLQIYEILDRPGGITVEQALLRADAAMGQHRDKAIEALRESVERLEQIVRERDLAHMDEVYERATFVLDIAGIFQPALCRAAQSLCELVHRLRGVKKWDWAAVHVHVSSMRLLIDMEDAPEESVKAVLDGLAAVVAKYPEPPVAEELRPSDT
ncbi:MAG: hypothetical protein ABUL42_00640 [Terricaulis silvestris]